MSSRPSPANAAERSLRLLVAAACILPLLVFAAASALSYRHHLAEARDRLWRTLDIVHEHAVKVFETVDLVRAQVDQAVAGLTDEEVRAQERPIHLRLKGLSDGLDQVSGIYIFDAKGTPLVSANALPVPPNPNASGREYFTIPRDADPAVAAVYVSDLLRSLADRRTEFFIVSSRRAGPGGDARAFAGVIAISIEPRYFRTFYAHVRQAGLDTLAIIRADGSILARHPETAAGPVRIPAGSGFMTSMASDPERGSYEVSSSVDGVTRLYAYRRLPRLPIYATAGIDRSTVMAEWRGTVASHLAFGLPATAGLILLSALALRRTREEALATRRAQDEMARREATEEQLRQSQKMEAIGRLTGGLAHDFNNLLTIVIGSLDLLSRRLGDGEARQRKLVDNALDGANRAARLTHRLLAFARQQPLDPKPLDVNRAVAEMSDILRSTVGATVRVETALAGDLWRTKVDRNALESAILNLAVNARDAMANTGGRLTIATANVRLAESDVAGRPDVRPGEYVRVALTDTGSGMPQPVLDRAFDPFFTTKEAGKGTGLGLSQVYGFAKQSDGHVALASQEGRGTTVELYLPRYAGHEPEEAPAPEPAAARRHDGRAILVVEDEDGVREFAIDALRDLGYRVVAAADGASALRHLGADPGIDLLLTDVVMPELDGRELADAALALRPDLKVLFMTGYTRNAVVKDGVLDPETDLIKKPFTQAQLAQRIRRALDEGGRPA